MAMQKCRFCTKPPFWEEGGAVLPAVCNSWLQISYWSSVSIEKSLSNKSGILVKSIYFEIQISLYNKEAPKWKGSRFLIENHILPWENKKHFLSKNDGNRPEISLITSHCWFTHWLDIALIVFAKYIYKKKIIQEHNLVVLILIQKCILKLLGFDLTRDFSLNHKAANGTISTQTQENMPFF